MLSIVSVDQYTFTHRPTRRGHVPAVAPSKIGQ